MSYIPEWATHYKITSHLGSGPREYIEVEFCEAFAKTRVAERTLKFHGWLPIKDLLIADVCQQIKDKPLSERIAEAVQTTDNINPSHYKTGAIECIDAIKSALTEEEYRGYLKGNIIKYTWRERMKGAKESLQKAAWYLERLIK